MLLPDYLRSRGETREAFARRAEVSLPSVMRWCAYAEGRDTGTRPSEDSQAIIARATDYAVLPADWPVHADEGAA